MDTPTRELTALNRAVAAQIRAILAGRNMRQAALASAMGVTEVWLSRRLREVQPLSLDDVDAISRALHMEPADLIALAVGQTWGVKPPYVPGAVRPPDRRPKGRPGPRATDRRSKPKRALTPEELSVIAA
jgi:transcriptional regulator with XRE-family HTH domain